jgi:hypothetical protein
MKMAHIFKDCDAETVFDAVKSKVHSSEARSLWGRMREEIKRAGIDGAVSYAEGEFARLREKIDHEIARLTAEE